MVVMVNGSGTFAIFKIGFHVAQANLKLGG